MIHKLRRKFILVAMLSMFIVLAVIVGTLNVANFVSMTSSAVSSRMSLWDGPWISGT